MAVSARNRTVRPSIGKYERLTNSQARSLTRVYDSWSVATRKQLLAAQARGASPMEKRLILNTALGSLSAGLIEVSHRGVIAGVRAGVGNASSPGIRSTVTNLLALNNQ